MFIPALNSFDQPCSRHWQQTEEMGGNITEGNTGNGEGGGSSSPYPAWNCLWGNILTQHWQSVLEYCKSMSSSCECFSNMSIPSLFVSYYCPILIKYCLSDGIPAAKVLQTSAQNCPFQLSRCCRVRGAAQKMQIHSKGKEKKFEQICLLHPVEKKLARGGLKTAFLIG